MYLIPWHVLLYEPSPTYRCIPWHLQRTFFDNTSQRNKLLMISNFSVCRTVVNSVTIVLTSVYEYLPYLSLHELIVVCCNCFVCGKELNLMLPFSQSIPYRGWSHLHLFDETQISLFSEHRKKKMKIGQIDI